MTIKTLGEHSYEEVNSIDQFSDKERALIKRAEEACADSYSPYSNFEVGSAVRLANDEIITGSNQENAAYPSGLCAERVALFYIGANYGDHEIVQIAVTAKRKTEDKFLPVSPCGSCRQVMVEYETRQGTPIEFLMRTGKSTWIKTQSCRILLPFSFDRNSL